MKNKNTKKLSLEKFKIAKLSNAQKLLIKSGSYTTITRTNTREITNNNSPTNDGSNSAIITHGTKP